MRGVSSYDGALADRVGEFRKHGQAEATKHRPPTDATYPDTHEVGLRTEAERLVAAEQSLFDGQITEAGRAVLDARTRIRENEEQTFQVLAEDSLASEVDAELSADRRALVLATEERIQAEVDWRGFRSLHGVNESAVYPDSQIWHWAIVLTLAVVETAANAFFYENAQGLLGGFFFAAAVAVANMGGAVLAGVNFRRRNLVQTDQRILGWGSLIAFVAFTIFCNALFAAFRSAYQLLDDPSDPAQLASGFRTAWDEAEGIFALRMHFGDLSSFLLFLTGIGLSFIAFWKGYTSDDPYPGYSRRDRRLKAAKQEETRLQDVSKQKLKDFLVGRRTTVQGLSSQAVSLVTLLHGRMSHVEHAERNLKANSAAIQRDYLLVLDAYRQSNLAVRGTPPPGYFSDRPDVAERIEAGAAPPTIADIEAAVSLVHDFRDRYQDRLHGKLNDLQERMSVILSEEFAAFLRSVEEEAQRKVQSGNMLMPTRAAAAA